ncbi:MAG: acyl-[ACP]--phospholipid O-acyltransferase [Candidatus Omnitrophica bacterium]|nr:acyl-[ACP]--phospholipid O-acyltransferase [Candidatus Omnitrophota bacterium]MDD5670731.1 acyl-[ACP]--phospholipid O-acyltransferase [Candidatus Omnitrophota bacterium]
MNRKDCKSTSFKGLMIAQFLGAFNDNAFKILVSFLIIRTIPAPEAATRLISLIGALFILPFILFSPYAGFCADRFRKRNVLVGTKAAEIVIMALGLFAMLSGNLTAICFILFLMATQSAFFSPAKYGILPEILDEENLSKGNGYLQMFTFLAIILGSAFGGQMSHIFKGHVASAGYFLIFVAVLGTAAIVFVDKEGRFGQGMKFQANSFKESVGALKEIKKDRWLFLTLIAICYFWFLGAIFQMNVLLYGKNILHLSDAHASLLLVMTSIGIGAGSMLAGYFSEKKIEYGLVPLGAIGISALSLSLGLSGTGYLWAFVLFLLLGVFSGFFIVPLNAYFQQQSPEDKRGKYIATLNIVSSFCILLASAYLWLFGSVFRFDPAQLFLVIGFFSVGITVYIFRTIPEAFLRLFNWLLTHSLYKMKVVGMENVPKRGGALLVCNHVSYADACLVLASVQRPIRFVMFREIYNLPVIHPAAKAMKAIPISYRDGPKGILNSLQEAQNAIRAGEIVCIFAEGQLTRHGNMLSFKKGLEYIMTDTDAPIIPMHLDRIWGSIFSYENGRYFWKFPKALPYPVTVSFGKPLTSAADAHEVRLAVQELSADAFKLRGKNQKKLHIAFIDEVKKHPFKFCMADSLGMKLNYSQALTSVMLLSRKLFPDAAAEAKSQAPEKVGILLPSSVMGSLINGATFFAGKIPVNLNFTASKESLASSITQCEMKTIITSRVFLKKAKLEELPGMIFVEDLKNKIAAKEKLKYFLYAFFLPKFLIKAFFVRGDRKNVNDTATIIFSSGSTGQPKGVVLSHANIFSNIEGLYQVLRLGGADVVMGVLPFFHSFGFTATLCMPVGAGIGVVYHANPLDAATIGDLARKYRATILMGTPTFLSAYLRKCTPEQFSTLRLVVAGAEKLKQSLAEAFYQKFKAIPYEGYGATELSPVVSLCIPDYIDQKEHVRQVGYKPGKVGHPIPGVAVKVVDTNTGLLRGYDEEGLLLVKGPNVMQGYLNNEEKTKEVLHDGWYTTGDVAMIDEDGFICITDRISRFSKIGGEMVPHIKIEDKILEILESVEPVCAVTSVPDEKKGERLAVLYQGEIDVRALWDKLNATDFPKLWIPKREDFFQVPEIPLLGSGKLDLKKIKTLALEMKDKVDLSAKGAPEEAP